MHRKKFREDEATDLINTGLAEIRKKSQDIHRHLERTVRKLERVTTPAPSYPQPEQQHG